MNIRQLESFVSIVERGSFAGAAEALVTTQSTVSARIRELERHLGVALFDRSGHRARLTPKGEAMLPYARQVLQLAHQIDRHVSDPQSIEGVIRIGAVGVIAMTLLPTLILAVRRHYPKVRVTVRVGLARTILDLLESADVDLALVNVPAAAADVETLPLRRENFAWMAAPALGIGAQALSPRELAQWPILSFPEESYHFATIDRWFAADQAVFAPTIACNSMDVLANLAAAGAGVALLARDCYAGMIRAGKLRPVTVTPALPPVEFAALYKRNALLHPLVEPVAQLASRLVD